MCMSSLVMLRWQVLLGTILCRSGQFWTEEIVIVSNMFNNELSCNVTWDCFRSHCTYRNQLDRMGSFIYAYEDDSSSNKEKLYIRSTSFDVTRQALLAKIEF